MIFPAEMSILGLYTWRLNYSKSIVKLFMRFHEINPYFSWLNMVKPCKITILAVSIPQVYPFLPRDSHHLRLLANDRIAWADGMVSPEDSDVNRPRFAVVFDDLLMGCVMVNVGMIVNIQLLM